MRHAIPRSDLEAVDVEQPEREVRPLVVDSAVHRLDEGVVDIYGRQ